MAKKLKDASFIKLLGPSCSSSEIEAVTKVLKSGWWGIGPVTEEFERAFAKFVGAHYAVAVNSCTAALHLSLKVLDSKNKGLPSSRQGNIIVPAFTFVSCAAVGIYEGLKVIFADIDEETFCLDPNDVKKKIDKDTVAVIPVHYAGHLADIDYADMVSVIEDCAHAAGSVGAGSIGKLACWSFHPVKNVATGDGGMVTTDDGNLAERIRKLTWLGIDLTTYDREKKGYNWEYHIAELGYKYHANDIMSSIALAQLRRVKKLNALRKKIAQRYNRELQDLPVVLPPKSESRHLYVIRVGKKYRNKLVDFLRERRISPGVHYKPLYYYPVFGMSVSEAERKLPITHRVWQEVVSLPIYPDLTFDKQSLVIEALKDFFE